MRPQQTRHEAGEADRLRDRQPETFAQSAPDERLAGPMEQLGRLWDDLAPAISDGLSDIRKHLVEEAWFGREVTPREVALTHHGAAPALAEGAPLGFRELMQAQAAMLPADQLDRDHQTPERPHDAGVDR